MTTIRAKLAAIVLALATAGALAALSPAGPAVADTSPACSPGTIETVKWHDGTTKFFCVPPKCFLTIVHFSPTDWKAYISCPAPGTAQSASSRDPVTAAST